MKGRIIYTSFLFQAKPVTFSIYIFVPAKQTSQCFRSETVLELNSERSAFTHGSFPIKGLYDTHLDCLSEMISAISCDFNRAMVPNIPFFQCQTFTKFLRVFGSVSTKDLGALSTSLGSTNSDFHWSRLLWGRRGWGCETKKRQGVKCWGMLRSGKVNVCKEYMMKVKCILSLSRILLFVLEKDSKQSILS